MEIEQLLETYKTIISIYIIIKIWALIIAPIIVILVAASCSDKLKELNKKQDKTNILLEEIKTYLTATNKNNVYGQKAIYEKIEEIKKGL